MVPSRSSFPAITLLRDSVLLLIIVPALSLAQGWISQSSGTDNWLYGASIVDENNATVVGYNGTILHTTNGGVSWVQQVSSATQPLIGVYFISQGIGVAVGRRGTIIRTINGGTTWTTQTSGTGEDLYSVTFIDANNGFAVGSTPRF